MFELADRLVGIYKTDNCTKSVTVDPLKIKLDVPSSQPSPLVHWQTPSHTHHHTHIHIIVV